MKTRSTFFSLLFLSVWSYSQIAFSADQKCEKWFERNIKKIQGDCELDCATFGTDMGTFHCPNACDDLCSSIEKAANSRPGRFLFYPGLTPAEQAQIYLDAHEENPLQPSAERAMDLANNRGGILGAQKLLKKNKTFDLRSLEQSALDDLRAHRLVILQPGLVIPKEPL